MLVLSVTALHGFHVPDIHSHGSLLGKKKIIAGGKHVVISQQISTIVPLNQYLEYEYYNGE